MSTPLGTVGARTTDIPLVLLAVTLAAVAVVLAVLRVWATASLVDVARHETAVVPVNLIVTALLAGAFAALSVLTQRLTLAFTRFASLVRDEVELDRLTLTLIAVIQETMQPAHASLWLRPIVRTKEPK